MSVINKKEMEIAKYIANFYVEEHNEQISPIRMQKTLYFLQGFWSQLNPNNEEVSNNELELKYENKLFDLDFEAWAYGPVVPGIQKNKREYFENSGYPMNEISDDPFVVSFIESVIKSLFEFSDFELVNRTHKDSSWINARKKGNNQKMDFSDIVKDYAK